MAQLVTLPLPKLDALPLGAHRLSMLTDEALFEACGVRVGFAGRDGGVSTGKHASLNTSDYIDDDPDCVRRNHEIVLEALGCPDASLVVPTQVHGTHIVDIDSGTDIVAAVGEAREGADGILVQRREVAALLNAADCPLVIVVSPSGRFAVVHAGWRGAVAGIAGKAVDALLVADSASADGNPASGPASYNAYIGPHIRSECFEVGVEVSQQFAQAFSPDVLEDERHVSLERAITADLVAHGLAAQRVASANVCTMCHPDRYFSYRATKGACGRHAGVAVAL